MELARAQQDFNWIESPDTYAREVLAKKRCTRCLYADDTPSISFNEKGVCNYCEIHDRMEAEYPTGATGERKLQELVDKIRAAGKGKAYDCVVGVSGGCDSSYLVYKAKELGLRPLAAHFDNTWNSAIATENIHRVLKKLNVDLFTIVVNNKEYDDIYRSFFKAGVPDIECPTDIGLAATLYKACEKHGIKYILEGHSFRTEGISPLGWLYMDGKYIKTVHKLFGSRPMKTFPNMPLTSFLKWMIVDRIKKVRPLYFMDYDKEATKKMLSEKFDWQWYGGHHLENRFTAFYHSYFIPRRLGADMRVLGYAALARSGQMKREEGLELLSKPPACDPEIVELVKTRLGFSNEEFQRLMSLPLRSYREFKTYKQTFEKLRPLFWLMYKLDLVPKSFYMKYTVKAEIS
jgi:N-acetyl sugar amidotransferase